MFSRSLLAGESWTSYTTHVKGFDAFYTSTYEEGAGTLIAALEGAGYIVDYLPNHKIPTEFPFTVNDLSSYACVILSDTGSNTLLLHPDTFTKSVRMPNRCMTIREYVKAGGGFLMVGGYMSFSGVDAKAKYSQTAVDLMEHPEGITPVVQKDHPILNGLPNNWPHFLGYNKTLPKDGCKTIMTIDGDPFIAVGAYGKGRTAAFTSDCAPHWGPPEFIAWNGYAPLWKNIDFFLIQRLCGSPSSA